MRGQASFLERLLLCTIESAGVGAFVRGIGLSAPLAYMHRFVGFDYSVSLNSVVYVAHESS